MWCHVTGLAWLLKGDRMKDSTKILGFILVVALAFFLGARYGRKTAKNPVDLRVVWDTTVIITHDTIVCERPVYRYSYVYDTVRTHFTTIEHDTVEVDLPIERKVYHEDSLYRAVVSGPRCGNYEPSLDSLVVWPTITTITIREKVKTPPPKLSLGITAGPSALVTPGGKVHGGIGATVGLQYRF